MMFQISRRLVRSGILLQVDQRAQVDLQLEVGQVAEMRGWFRWGSASETASGSPAMSRSGMAAYVQR